MWEPASFIWSPRGSIFRKGFWDYPLERRGLLFAPVSLTATVYRQPGFVYSPAVVVQSESLPFYLFACPKYDHYFFGDYFAAKYDSMGIYPWFTVGRHAGLAYDPLFAYYDWEKSRSEPQWAERMRGWHDYYRTHPDYRPPHNLAAQRRLMAVAENRPDRRFLAIADNLHNFRQLPNPRLPLTAVSENERTRLAQTAQQIRQSAAERLKRETQGMAGGVQGRLLAGTGTILKAPERLRLPKVAGTFAESGPGTPQVAARPPEGRVDGLRQTFKPVIPREQTGPPSETPNEAGKPIVPPEASRHEERLPGEMHKPPLPGSPEIHTLPPPRSREPLPEPNRGRAQEAERHHEEPAAPRTERKEPPRKEHESRVRRAGGERRTARTVWPW